MKDIEIKINKETRMVQISKHTIGNDGENLQGNLVFTFDEFVDGQARLEYQILDKKYYIVLTKKNNTYTIPIKNIITKCGMIDMQVIITEGVEEEEIPVFKSNKFYLYCNESINAVDEAPDEYQLWIEIANTKLNQIDNVDIDITTDNNNTKVEITRKDGTKKSAIVSGSTGGSDDYDNLSNKPKINGVELVDDKTLEELGIQPIGNYASEEYVQDQVKNIDIPEVDLSNYYTKEDIDGLPSNRIMLGDGSPSISLHRSQNISLVDYMKTIDKRGLYSCYVQSGILDNPPKASSSLRGIFEIYFTKKENGNMIAWIILFDEAGQMHTRYVKGTASEWATNGLPDNTLTKEGISADAKAVGDKITELNNSISAKASIEDMTNYIEENKEDLKGDKGDKGDTGEKGQDGKNGTNGTNGVDGKTPVKGTDYFTEADINEIVDDVLAKLPNSEGVSY